MTVAFDVAGDRGEQRRVRTLVGDVVRRNVRAVDDTGRVSVGGRDLVVAVLPETPRSGAEVVGAKVEQRLREDAGTSRAEVRWFTHPQEDEAIEQLLLTLRAVVAREHPEAMTPR